jgi:site-specific recombinase XerC
VSPAKTRGSDQLDLKQGAGHQGKGRKERAIPLTAPTATVIRQWLRERASNPSDPLFPGRTRRRLTCDAIEHRLTTHRTIAVHSRPTLWTKKLTPHTLRHTTAMTL